MINAAEVLVDEVRDICAGVRAQNVEEVVGRDDLTATLIEIILHEGEEGFVTDALADFFKEVCTLEIGRIRLRTEALTFIDGYINEAFRLVEVNAIRPPPRNKIGIGILVIKTFGISGE